MASTLLLTQALRVIGRLPSCARGPALCVPAVSRLPSSLQLTPCRQLSDSTMAPPARVFYMAKSFVGEPKPTDFEIKEEQLPELKDGGKSMRNTDMKVGVARRPPGGSV